MSDVSDHEAVEDDETGEPFVPEVEINAKDSPAEKLDDEDPPAEKLDGDEDEKPPKVKFDEAQQVIFDREIDKKVQVARTAERRAAAAEARNVELEAKLPKEARPGIPEMPDTFDEDYDSKMLARDGKIAEAAAFDARTQQTKEQAQANENQQLREGAAQLQAKADKYGARAADLGVDQADLVVAAKAVAEAGINEALTMHILDDEQGPAITKHLADNPRTLEKVVGMTPLAAAAYIETQVKPSLSNKPISRTPSPPRRVNGSGNPAKDRGPPGARFE